MALCLAGIFPWRGSGFGTWAFLSDSARIGLGCLLESPYEQSNFF